MNYDALPETMRPLISRFRDNKDVLAFAGMTNEGEVAS